MILTGKEIIKQYNLNNITLDPFEFEQVKRDSYNYRLGQYLKKSITSDCEDLQFETIDLSGTESYVLEPGHLYLGTTYEVIGSKKYAMSLIGKSSMGRLGMFLQISANLGHTNSSHKWTLEIVPTIPIRVYYKMVIGQVSFWNNYGEDFFTDHIYNKYNEPKESLFKLNVK